MCGDNFVYVLDKNKPNHIRALDYNFRPSGITVTGLGTIHDCSVDMCSRDELAHSSFQLDTIVISTSFPLGTVRLLVQNHGVLWHLDIRNSLELPMRFNPGSVSIIRSVVADKILFADRYSDKVSKACMIEKMRDNYCKLVVLKCS